MTFNHSTRLQFLQRLRERYRTATQVEALKIAAWLYNNLTLAELRNVFNLTQTQAQNLQSRLQTKAQQLAALQAAAGE